MGVYSHPLYYEIAFGFVDPKRQVSLFERFIRKYSAIPVSRFLDIGCGPALQLREIAGRGYQAVALDSSSRMLAYVRNKAKEEGTEIITIKSDLVEFETRPRVDFAFIMMGTVNYMRSNNDFLRHLDSVARSLNAGGLYLMEDLRLDSEHMFAPQKWTRKREGIKVRAFYRVELKDVLTQMLTERLRLEVDDYGRKLVLEECQDYKIIFPEEFRALVQMNGKFEFLGWFHRDSMRRLTRADADNIALLRRKGGRISAFRSGRCSTSGQSAVVKVAARTRSTDSSFSPT